MTTVRFGTDGIRGIAGETLTVEIAAALGAALMQQHPAGLVLLGRDTRPSGAALAIGLYVLVRPYRELLERGWTRSDASVRTPSRS